MKTEMEKKECKHQESSAEVTVKHSRELNDLGKNQWSVIRVSTIQTQRILLSTRFILSVCLWYIETSYSQKLIVEHERLQDLQHQYQRMKEDFEMQRKSSEEHTIQALEELTQSYEAKLQEKTQHLAQVRRRRRKWQSCGGVRTCSGLFDFVMFLCFCSIRRRQSRRSVGSKRS